ncbi:MAG: UDP-N-acetylmuramoyl-L-alanine--D-glutamate ligase [Lachnospiraceae bacterium]|nr:UDP-N-acetylmuramoyl-L-alanine--D-glutamate ligase [Lachnospiraceae bacterium]
MKSLVIGNGLSGMPLAELLTAKGVPAVYFDAGGSFESYDMAGDYDPEELQVYSGTLPAAALEDVGQVIAASDIPMDDPVIKQLRLMGFKVIGEIELAASYDRGRILAVTGTKGKTSATSLLGKIVRDRTRNAFTVGDGIASYADAVCQTTKDSTTVVKTCARDLEAADRLHPAVSAIINIQPSRVSGYESEADYVTVKERILMNQTAEDHIILNYDDPYTRRLGMRLDAGADGPRPFFFSARSELKIGLFLKRGGIILRDRWGERELMKTSELSIVGIHNLENAFAAISMAYRYGIPTDSIIKSCREYVPVAHRVEYVATKNGVRFYNDSKGTDVSTAINGIESMDCPTYLIGGGYDSGADYGDWIDSFRGKVRKLVLIGQTREKMASCAQDHGFFDYIYAEDLEEAVRICGSCANPGEAVLLSPACEGRGMYKSYEERGNAFRAIVESL